MTVYFGRIYELAVAFGTGEDATTRTFDGVTTPEFSPFNIQFSIDQSPNAEHSYGEVTIFGLSQKSRLAIYERGSAVTLSAGWRGEFGRIFDGQIKNVAIGRQGADQFVRLFGVTAQDTFNSSSTFKSWGARTQMREIIRDVAETFGYPVEFVGDFEGLGRTLKGRTIARDSKSALRSLARSYGFTWALLNNRLYIIRDRERRDSPPIRYTPTTGMIGTPEITELGVDIDVLLNPFIRPWDTFTVESETGSLRYNAIYYQEREFPATQGESENEVVALTHEGDFYGDTWQTSLTGQRPGASRNG